MSNIELVNNSNQDNPQVERLNNAVYVSAGNYCRAIDTIETDVRGANKIIEKGEILLIQSLKHAHDKIHSVVVRPHPRHYNSDTKPSYYQFLIEDFLDKFELLSMDDGNAVRNKELNRLQLAVTERQQQLFETQSNPQKMLQIAMDIYSRRIEHKDSKPAIQVNGEVNVADVIELGVTPELVSQLKESATQQQDIIKIQSEWLLTEQKKLQELFNAMLPYGTEMAAAQNASMQDINRDIEKRQAGIETLELYLGTGVQLFTVKEGEPAPYDEKLTVMQERLYGDVELSLYKEEAIHLDARNCEILWREFQTNQEFVERVFPTKRCIALMCCNRRSKDYGNFYESAVRNQENKEVFLLVRNGDNIHVVYSPISTHLHSHRLFPAMEEVNRHLFKGRDKINITIDDLEYSDKLSIIEAELLHYKRFIILIAGLDHREQLFGDFYPRQSFLNMFYPEFQEKYMRFIHDGDGEGMLPTQEEKRPSLYQYLQERNSKVRKGSRVVIQASHLINSDSAPSCFTRNQDEAERRYYPTSSFVYANVERDSKGYFVKVPVQHVYDRSKKNFNARVSIANDLDTNALLCIDKISPQDLDFYITSRTHRMDFVSYLEMFKNAKEHIVRQHEISKPLFDLLYEALDHVHDSILTTKAAKESAVEDVVSSWWSSIGGEVSEAAVKNITAETKKQLLDHLYYRASASFITEHKALVDKAAVDGVISHPLKLSVDYEGNLWLYTKLLPSEEINTIEPNRFVKRTLMTLSAKKKLGLKKSSFVLPKQYAVDEHIICEWDELADVADFDVNQYPIGEYKSNYKFHDYQSKADFVKYMSLTKEFLTSFYSRNFSAELAKWIVDAFCKQYKKLKPHQDEGDIRLAIPFFYLYGEVYVLTVSSSLKLFLHLVKTHDLQDYVDDTYDLDINIDFDGASDYGFNLSLSKKSIQAYLPDYIVREFKPSFVFQSAFIRDGRYEYCTVSGSDRAEFDLGILASSAFVAARQQSFKNLDLKKEFVDYHFYSQLDVNDIRDYGTFALDKMFKNPNYNESLRFMESALIVHSNRDPISKEILSSKVYVLVTPDGMLGQKLGEFAEQHDIKGNNFEKGEYQRTVRLAGFTTFTELEKHWNKRLDTVYKAFFSEDKAFMALFEFAKVRTMRDLVLVKQDGDYMEFHSP